MLDLQYGSISRDVSFFFKNLSSERGGVLLDVGCGAQPYRKVLPAKWTYRSIDWQGSVAAFGYESPGTIYYDGEIWPVGDQSVDVVFSTETLEHVSSPGKFLEEAWRCLGPDGRIFLTVPFAARWHFVPFDYWRFTPSGLKLLLEKAGFSKIKVYGRGNELTVASYKAIGLIMPLLLVHRRPGNKLTASNFLYGAMGVLCLPFLFAMCILGNLSFRYAAGNDCLGYTVLARKSNSIDP